MEDNTAQGASSAEQPKEINQPKVVDMNFIEKSDSIQTGCVAGDHQYKIIDLSVSGQNTVLSLECIQCQHKSTSLAEGLGVNNLIDPNSSEQKNTIPTISEPQINQQAPRSPIPTVDIARMEAFRKLKEAEKMADSFWDSIKGKR